MNITMSSGNFNLTISGTLHESATAKLLEKGLKYELERNVLTKTYLTLKGVDGKRKGSKVLPKDFERDSVPFDEANAQAFAEAAAAPLKLLGDFTVNVSQYIKGESQEARKRATLVFEKTKAKGDAALEKLAAICGYEVGIDTGFEDEGAFIEAIHEWLMSTEE